RYITDEYSKCVSCTRRWAEDPCRFQNLRSFFRDDKGTLVGLAFEEKQDDSRTVRIDYPHKWNIPLDKIHLHQMKKIIAAALLPILREELQHISLERIIYRPRESEVRAACDTCLVSIFSCSWMCRICGRELCSDCFRLVEDAAVQPNSRATRPCFLNLLACDHAADVFSPITRFSKPELTAVIQNMESLLKTDGLRECWAAGDLMHPQDITPASNDSEVKQELNSDMAHLQAELATGKIPFREMLRFVNSELTDEIFRTHWAQGEPVLVTDVGKSFKIRWSPEYSMTKHGNVLLFECQTDEDRTTAVEFLKTTRKLKDWPPWKNFRDAFPELYDDFIQAVPIPHYVCRDGAYNIASHFPTNVPGFPLGPKMCNAKGSVETLRMDIIDTFNLTTYAATHADGQEGYAVWDIFRPQDRDKLREFMRANYPLSEPDSIRPQPVYLDDAARLQLWETYSVKSYRFNQKAGEAVFIPAGCAYQVCHPGDCIKATINFVSPESTERCEKLTRYFMAGKETKAWKEGMFQLRTMMWFAWLSCCRQESLQAGN
ncbi:hypothetical protein K438DRAFT_1631881, partial [Mycena galopus ATCC 62051]